MEDKWVIIVVLLVVLIAIMILIMRANGVVMPLDSSYWHQTNVRDALIAGKL